MCSCHKRTYSIRSFFLISRFILYIDATLCLASGIFLMYTAGMDFSLSPCWRILFVRTNSSDFELSSATALAINLFSSLCGVGLCIFGSLFVSLSAFVLNGEVSEEKGSQRLQYTISNLSLLIGSIIHVSFATIFFLKRNDSTLQPMAWLAICVSCGLMMIMHCAALSISVCHAAILPSPFLFRSGSEDFSSGAATLLSDPLIQKVGSSSGTESKYVDTLNEFQLDAQKRRDASDNDGGQESATLIALNDLAAAKKKEQSRRRKRGYGTLQLLKIARPHKHWLYWACAILLLRLPLSLSVPHWVAESISCLIESDYKGAYWNVAYLCLAGTGDAVLDFWCVYLFGTAQQKIIRGLRLQLFRAILSQEIGFFDCTKTGEITSRLTTDCAEMANDLTSVFRFTIESLVRIGGIIVYMFVRSWRLGLLALAVIPITSLINRLYAKYMHHNQIAVQAALAKANSVAQEAIGAIRTVCSFAMESGELLRYHKRIEVYYNLIVRQYCIQGVYYMVCNTFLINTAVQAAILGYGGFLVYRNLLQAKILLAFMLYQGQLQEYFQNLFNSFTSLVKSSGAAAKVFDYIERVPRYKKKVRLSTSETIAKDLYSSDSEVASSIRLPYGAISFKNVRFCYPSRPETEVLRGLSIDVAPGSCVAFVGASGNGKSTIFSLLEHFYEPQCGSICIDGISVADYSHVHLHKIVAMVQQEPQLMSGTIEENILYSVGQDGLSLSRRCKTHEDMQNMRKRIIDAATAANAHNFIVNELQNGYQTEVGERGVQLSGGQKQRIAIARCLLQDPKILLLDEATSALDAQSEAIVQNALERAMIGRTTLVIAHRLSTIQNADQVFVIHDGRVAEQGTHDELLRDSNGLYFELVQRQLSRQ